MTLEELDESASVDVSTETDRASVAPSPRHLPPTFVLRVERPMVRTLAVLNDLADVLARQGVEVRGAFARPPAASREARDLPPREEPPRRPKGFVGHFALPTTDNEGNPFSSSLLLSILLELYECTGGATFRETVGLWQDDEDGACYVDLLIDVEVWTSDRKRLVAFLEETCRKLRQKCIPLRIERSRFVSIKRSAGVAS